MATTKIHDVDISWTVSGSGPLLLLVHGLPFQKGMWNDVVPLLERHFRLARLDLPGFGESSAPQGTPSMSGYADILEGLLRTLGDERALVAGHSMGGYALLDLAERFPERLRGMVMLCSRAIADTPDQAANRKAMALRLKTEPPDFVAELMLPRMAKQGSADVALRKRIREAMDPLRAEGIAWCQLAIAARPDFSVRLGGISTPALVLAGSHDAVVPLEESGIMAANFRAGRLAVIENAGHMPMIEQPRETATALVDWAKSVNLL
jgi:pimeloyl-ACP methyl ester carboxylesterase